MTMRSQTTSFLARSGILVLGLSWMGCSAQENLGDRATAVDGLGGSDAGTSAPPAPTTPTPTPAPSASSDAGITDSGAPTGHVVLFGGIDDTSSLSDTWTWDGSSWKKETVTSGPSARGFATGASLGGKVVLFGGSDDVVGDLADTWTWNGAAWTQHAGTGPSARHGAVASTLGSNVVLFGGGNLEDTDTWLWNGSAWSQKTGAGGPNIGDGWGATTFGGSVVLVGESKIFSFGGSTWVGKSTGAGGPSANGGASVATLGANVLLFGGGGTNFNSLDETWTWDGTNWTLRNVKGPGARSNAGIASVNGTVVLFGGCTFGFPGTTGTGRHCFNDTWTFDGSNWTQHDVPGPSARAPAIMAAE